MCEIKMTEEEIIDLIWEQVDRIENEIKEITTTLYIIDIIIIALLIILYLMVNLI
jgi:hypothetical protein